MKRFQPYPDPKKTNAQNDELTGTVWKVMQTIYKTLFLSDTVTQSKIEITNLYSSLNYIRTYNEKGSKTEEVLYGSEGRQHNVFNDKALPVQTMQYDKTGSLAQKTVNTFDKWGHQIIHLTTNGAGELISRVVNNFNEEGKQLDHFHYFGKEERVINRSVYSYDEKGNHLSIVEKDEKGTIVREMVNRYDDKGRRLEYKIKHMSDGKFTTYQHNTYKYNEQGDVIELNFYNDDGSLKDSHVWTHEYNSEGKKILPPNPAPSPFEKPEGVTEECEYDGRGNWIRKTVFFNKIPENILTREIIYADEPERPLVHPVTVTPIEEMKNLSNTIREMKPKDAKWLVDTPGLTVDNFSLLRYYALSFKEQPSVINYTGPYIEAMALLKELKENFRAQEIHSYSTIYDGNGERLIKYTLVFPGHEGYLLQANSINTQDQDDFTIPPHIDVEDYDYVYISTFTLLRPSDASGNRDESFEQWLNDLIYRCSLRKKPEKPVINIIEVRQGNFAMKEYAVEDDFEIKDLDINYGEGFSKFNDDLMNRFHKSTKGLVLFHGQPGTGKTYYIRHLLRKMVVRKKIVIYMPPNMVDHLVEPGFMTFLSERVRSYSSQGNFCVLLIEDAEPLLTKRVEGVRIQGVTNLLNMSDGLLNDMLNLQIICTFNVDLRKLDSALLRPGRLIARKEFKALAELDANLLAQRLGIKHQFKAPATLGEIYAMRKDSNTLIHDVDPDKNSSTNIDDLL